ncbi:MAG: hypothetical protein EOL87_03170 [Spartobacteria bacterium]|nr:hypothetical protein [Spartobacteria bacterium]
MKTKILYTLYICVSLSFLPFYGLAQTPRVNELCAQASDRLLRWDTNGIPKLGTGASWYDVNFSDSDWSRGDGDFGYGGTNTVGTDLGEEMYGQSFSLYIRTSFTPDSALLTATSALQLVMSYDDGFIAYLNGKEIARRNMGATNSFAYHDQPTFNECISNETITIGIASNLLISGTNVLAIQGHNLLIDQSTFQLSAGLNVESPSSVLVRYSDEWAYKVGTTEPSGGAVDPAFDPDYSSINTDWTQTDYDASNWSIGAGPIGYGDDDDATDVKDEVYGIAYSVYMRQTFQATTTDIESTNSLIFTVDFDDGYVAYVNGKEISRSNLGTLGEIIPHNQAADPSHEAGIPVTTNIGTASNWLTVGENVFSVQVHNQDKWSSDMTMSADLDIVGTTTQALVRHENNWQFFIGTTEPRDAEQALREPDFYDWVELINTNTSPINLKNWALSDDATKPTKWVFPDVSIGAGKTLLVFCSGYDIRETNAPYLHTSFKLSASGEYLGLFNAQSVPVSQITPEFPKQPMFHSYGWDTVSQSYRYFDTPTPEEPNSGLTYSGVVANPIFNTPQGFHTGSVNVEIRQTDNADIRYTLDGSEPTLNHGSEYSTALTLTSNTIIRAKAFHTNELPSECITATYLIDQPAVIQQLPVLSMVGDAGRTFYDPTGITSINGGKYTGDDPDESKWSSTNAVNDYNIPMEHGRPFERFSDMAYIPSGTNTALQTGCGIRFGGGDYVRSITKSGIWTNGPAYKPSFNLYFRDEYGDSRLENLIITNSPIKDYDNLRLRAGNNDWYNPFIRDELSRRLAMDCGYASSIGSFLNLYINGEYKGYYNIVEKYETSFFQSSYDSTNLWDVIKSYEEIADGDAIAWRYMLNFFTNQNLSVSSNYTTACSLLDVTNFVDYLLIETYSVNPDWPDNNWAAAKERTTNGIFRFYVWDSEQCFVDHYISGNCFTQYPAWWDGGGKGLNGQDTPIANIYRALTNNSDFKMLFADRIQKQFFDSGALTDKEIAKRFVELETTMRDTVEATFGTFRTTITNNWIPNRRAIAFQQYTDEGLWPALSAPSFSTTSGTVMAGTSFSMTNNNGSGTIYYTLDGSDPRLSGGGIGGTSYTTALSIDYNTIIRARCYDSGQWSAERTVQLITDAQPTLKITEIMYNPPEPSGAETNSAFTAQDFEYVEFKNTGTNTISLIDMKLTNAINFTFPAFTLAPGALVVIAHNTNAFTLRYTNTSFVAGAYEGNLNNAGETINLLGITGTQVLTCTFNNSWYPPTDGLGYSLVPTNPVPEGSPSDMAYWRVSSEVNGSPGHDDPTSTYIPPLLVNEALTHTDLPQSDAIELYNPTATNVSLDGWYLTDNRDLPTKYQITAGQSVDAHGYWTIYENTGDTNNIPITCFGNAFALNSHGDSVFLFSPNLQYSHGFTFEGAENGISLGRYENSIGTEDFPAQWSTTLGTTNDGPRVGPVAITEFMYNPPDGQHEFIELVNITTTDVMLYNTTNSWQLTGIGYTFPTNIIMHTNGVVLLVRDTITPEQFRTSNNVPANVPIFTYSGKLDNGGETLRLKMPDTPDEKGVPYIVTDKITYDDQSPWPTNADGYGSSLARRTVISYGNEPTNWFAQYPPTIGIAPPFTPIVMPTPVPPVPTPTPSPTPTPFPTPVTTNSTLSWLMILLLD